jgi:hypothetical protein
MAGSGVVTIRAAIRKTASTLNAATMRRAFRSVGGSVRSERGVSRFPRLLSFSASSIVALTLPRGLPFVVLLLALLRDLGTVNRKILCGVARKDH